MKTQLDSSPARIGNDCPQTPPSTPERAGAKSSSTLRPTLGAFLSRPPSEGEASSSAQPRKSLQQLLDSPPSTPRLPETELAAPASSRPGPSGPPKGQTLQQLLMTEDPGTPPALRSLALLQDDDGELTSEAVELLRLALPHGGAAIQQLCEQKSSAHMPTQGDYGEPKPLKGEGFEKFMAMAQADVKTLAKRAKLSLEDAAELMRLGLSQGKLDEKLTHANKARMMFALYGIREKHSAEEPLATVMACHPRFQGLPLDDAWRMALDHRVWGNGEHQGLRFENEPGYMAGMFRGLTAMIQADLEGQRLDAVLFKELHDHATQGVVRMQVLDGLSGEMGSVDEGRVAQIDAFTARPAEKQAVAVAADSHIPIFVQGYPDRPSVSFALLAGLNLTEAGYYEMLADYEPGQPFYLLTQTPGQDPEFVTHEMQFSADRFIKLVGPRALAFDIELTAHNIVREHARKIESAAPGDDKLRAIARCCQALERAHLFADGNARTVGFLALNKLLLENGMAPAMFEDPNHFDGFSADELVEEIKRGQVTFARYAGQDDEA